MKFFEHPQEHSFLQFLHYPLGNACKASTNSELRKAATSYVPQRNPRESLDPCVDTDRAFCISVPMLHVF